MPNNDPYPAIDQVSDRAAQQALRLIWDKLASMQSVTFGPATGTLSPDTKPTLGVRDVGSIFYATDYNRRYRWTGTAWEDDAGAPGRYQVAYYPQGQVPQPASGWMLCNGTAVNASTPTGGTIYFETPIIPMLNGLVAWIRL